MTRNSTTSFSARLCALRCLTPLHVGGESEPGLVDKPMLRERTRPYPLVPGSALKGVVREDAELRGPTEHLNAAFGRANTGKGDGDNAGSLVFTDALLVALPVRSYFGTMAWTTTSNQLNRLHSWWEKMGLAPPAAIDNKNSNLVHVDKASAIRSGDRVLIEDLSLLSITDAVWLEPWRRWIADRWFDEGAERLFFESHFAVVPEKVFDHLCRYALEVRARIKIDRRSRTVEKGKLWYEELVPESTLMASTVFCERVFQRAGAASSEDRRALAPVELLDQWCTDVRLLQFGGTASVGRGFTELRYSGATP